MSTLSAACSTVEELLKQLGSMGPKALGTFLQRLPWIKQICKVEESKLPEQEMLKRFLKNPITMTPYTSIYRAGDWRLVPNKLGWQDILTNHQISSWRKWGIELSDDVLHMYQIVLDRLGRRSISLLDAFGMKVVVVPELTWPILLKAQDSLLCYSVREELEDYETLVGKQARSEEMAKTRPGIYLIGAPQSPRHSDPAFPHHRGELYYWDCETVFQEFNELMDALGMAPVASQLPTLLELMVAYTYFNPTVQKQSEMHRLFDGAILRECYNCEDKRFRTSFVVMMEEEYGSWSKRFFLIRDEKAGKSRSGKIYPFVMLADTKADGDADSCRYELEILQRNKALPRLVRFPAN